MERLEVKNLSFSFGFKEILKDINFTLEKGKVISIVGPSGGGKTTPIVTGKQIGRAHV